MTPTIARLTDSQPPRCPWCKDFDPRDPINRGVSHKICPDCHAKLKAQVQP